MPRVRSVIVVLSALCLWTGFGLAQTAKKTTAKKKTTASTMAAKRPATLSKTSPHTRTATTASREEVSSGTARVRTRKVVVTRKLIHGKWVRTTQIVHTPAAPSYQTHPDPERYQEIQQALAKNGYYKGEVNGQWNDDSVEALKQFQTDHKLVNDGKISALSLIGLGLGPNRESAASKPAPAPTAAVVPPEAAGHN
jgi:hypothetical protein